MTGLLDAYRFLQSGAEALAEVERNGIHIDVKYCNGKIEWLDYKIDQAKRRLDRTDLAKAWRARFGSGLNWTSGPQLRAVLYADLHVKPFKQTASGEDGIDEESLRQVDVPGVDNLLSARRYKKMRDFLVAFVRYQIDGYLYPSFLLHTVATYRSSSSEPNMQNLSKRDKEAMEVVRRAIVPRPGHRIVEVDFSGLEVSIAACYHKDPRMISYLNDPSSDMHADMAHDIFKLPLYNERPEGFGTLRQAAKNGFVFPEFYGDYFEPCAYSMACNWCKLPRSGIWGAEDGVKLAGKPIAGHLIGQGIDSLSSFADHIQNVEHDFWNKRFRVYNRWRKDWYAEYQRTGSFEMKTGFRCAGVMGKNMVINYPIQGAAFHCLLWTLIRLVDRVRGWRSVVIGEVHDSALLDVHPDEFDEIVALCRKLATADLAKAWKWIYIPLRVEVQASVVDGSWAEMEVI